MASSKSFSIHGKNLKLSTREEIQPYIDEMLKVKDLEEIHFGGNTLGVEACEALADALKGNTTLKIADLADIFTGRLITEIPQALKALCDALVTTPALVELNLSDNAFGGRSAEPMVNFLTNNRTFSILKLNNNGLGVWGGTTVANALLESAKLSKQEGRPSNLRTVICGRNRLENGSAPFWADAFKAHGGLRCIKMPQNGIRMEGVEALAKGLESCPDLEEFDLQDNTFTERGSRAVATALPFWPNLKILNLSDCLLSPRGGISLGHAFVSGKNRNLEVLKLQYGELDHRSLNLIAEAIKDHWSSLKTLELNGNRADPEDECITNIKDALESHGNVEALDELDDMEEYDEDEEEEHVAVEEAEELDKEEAAAATATSTVPTPAKADDTDDLAKLLDKVTI